jgi:hypothetical protein
MVESARKKWCLALRIKISIRLIAVMMGKPEAA